MRLMRERDVAFGGIYRMLQSCLGTLCFHIEIILC